MPPTLTFPAPDGSAAYGMLGIARPGQSDDMRRAEGSIDIPDDATLTLRVGFPPGLKLHMPDGSIVDSGPPPNLSAVVDHPSDAYDTLVVHGAEMDDLEAIAHFTGVRSLTISGPGVTSALVDTVVALPKLRELAVIGLLDDADVETLSSIALTSIALQGTSTTPAALEHLARMGSLEELTLEAPWFGDDHLSSLPPQLRRLRLEGSAVTPEAVVATVARTCSKLETLDLVPAVLSEDDRLRLFLAVPGLTVDGEYLAPKAAAKIAAARGIENR